MGSNPIPRTNHIGSHREHYKEIAITTGYSMTTGFLSNYAMLKHAAITSEVYVC